MSTMLAEAPQISRNGKPDDSLAMWKERAARARRDRRRYEIAWELCQKFVQGAQWVGWDTHNHRVIELPNPQHRERHTVNVITGFFWTQQGKLSADDIKPDITFRRSDVEGRHIANGARMAFDWAWDEELDADGAYLTASIKRLTYGFGFLRCRYDPLYGQHLGEVPIQGDGTPYNDPEKAYAALTQAVEGGQQLPFRKVREGRIVWEPGGPFNFLPPPGIDHERDFPWFCIERPIDIDVAKSIWPGHVFTEERIRTVDTMGPPADGGSTPTPQGGGDRLKNAITVTSGYEMPTSQHPEGRTIVWAQNEKLQENDTLPYVIRGRGLAGVACLKYHVVDGRFWPVGLVEPTIGPQRQRNIARSQAIEAKDRVGLPRIFTHDNAITETNTPQGITAEVISIRPGYDFPKETPGIGPGPWLQQEAEINDADLRQVVGIGDVSLSQVPSGVSAYSAFTLLVEQDDRRIGTVRQDDRRQVAALVKVTVEAIRKYWPPEKEIPFAGEDGLIDVFTFQASQMPTDVSVMVPDSAPMPKSQAAETQLIIDIFDRGISSGQPLPLDWLVDSLREGRMQPLPKKEMMMQEELAQNENMLIAHGQLPQVQAWHNDEIHLMQHRAALEAYAVVAGSPLGQQFQQVEQNLNEHIQMHLQSAAQKQMQASQMNGRIINPNAAPGQQAGTGRAATSQAGAGANPMQLHYANRLSPAPGNVNVGQ